MNTPLLTHPLRHYLSLKICELISKRKSLGEKLITISQMVGEKYLEANKFQFLPTQIALNI